MDLRESNGTWNQSYQLENEDVPNACPCIESGRGLDTGVMGPRIDDGMDSHLVAAALRSGFLRTNDSIEAERFCLLDELNWYKMENEQLKIGYLRKMLQ